MDSTLVKLIDFALESFWREPSAAKIEGALQKEIAAKYYLVGKGVISDEDTLTYVDKIRSKLEILADKDKKTLPTPPISPADGRSNASDTSYQGPGQDFNRVSIWVKSRDEREGALCSFRNDEDEHVISQTMINCLDAPVQDGYALLRWSPDQTSITYRTSFRVAPTKLCPSDIVLGKEWWEDPKAKTNCKEETKTRHMKNEPKSPKEAKERRRSDAQSVYSTSTNKSHNGNGGRKTSESKEDRALKRVGKVLYQMALEQENSDSSSDSGG